SVSYIITFSHSYTFTHLFHYDYIFLSTYSSTFFYKSISIVKTRSLPLDPSDITSELVIFPDLSVTYFIFFLEPFRISSYWYSKYDLPTLSFLEYPFDK